MEQAGGKATVDMRGEGLAALAIAGDGKRFAARIPDCAANRACSCRNSIPSSC